MDDESKSSLVNNFINNEFSAPTSSEYIDVIAPADNSVCARVANSNTAVSCTSAYGGLWRHSCSC